MGGGPALKKIPLMNSGSWALTKNRWICQWTNAWHIMCYALVRDAPGESSIINAILKII